MLTVKWHHMPNFSMKTIDDCHLCDSQRLMDWQRLQWMWWRWWNYDANATQAVWAMSLLIVNSNNHWIWHDLCHLLRMGIFVYATVSGYDYYDNDSNTMNSCLCICLCRQSMKMVWSHVMMYRVHWSVLVIYCHHDYSMNHHRNLSRSMYQCGIWLCLPFHGNIHAVQPCPQLCSYVSVFSHWSGSSIYDVWCDRLHSPNRMVSMVPALAMNCNFARWLGPDSGVTGIWYASSVMTMLDLRLNL